MARQFVVTKTKEGLLRLKIIYIYRMLSLKFLIFLISRDELNHPKLLRDYCSSREIILEDIDTNLGYCEILVYSHLFEIQMKGKIN